MALLKIENLNFTYATSKKQALKNIDLEIDQGDFVLLCGESGCGKTTLLRLLKKELRPDGELEGKIYYDNNELHQLDPARSACEIGYVMQNPDAQIVTDKVWHELAFGLESLGESSTVIRRRVAEICGFFGIGELYHKKTCELSGGQKQLVNLASIMVMQPQILVLDEPTAQLDPISASDFISALKKINDELGITVILAEHRLEEVFPLASKVVLMHNSQILISDSSRALAERLASIPDANKMYPSLPAAIRIFHALGGEGVCPLTVKEGKKFIRDNFNNIITRLDHVCNETQNSDTALEIKGGYFRYERNSPDVLKALDLKVKKGEIFCILGANGSGKTTLLGVLSGTRKMYKGKLHFSDKNLRTKIAALPQNPQSLFVKSTVLSDLQEITTLLGYKNEEAQKEIDIIASKLDITQLYERHPFDLSGGEAQKAALAKLLLTKPEIILLDEPTKGLDPFAKKQLADILKSQKNEGKTVIIVTHDVEFAAEHSECCAMFFDGQLISTEKTTQFFAKNHHYTTAASRMSSPYYENAVTTDMLIELCRLNGRKKESNGK